MQTGRFGSYPNAFPLGLFRDEITPNSNARACEDHSHLSIDGFRPRATDLWQRFRRAH
jgi:hypothetical protein